MNLNTFEVLYGKIKDYTLEEKVAKNGTKYIVIKRPYKGQGYIERQITRKESSKGNKYIHGVIIWFNKNSCTVKPITCQTYKSAKGFSRKTFKDLISAAYSNWRRPDPAVTKLMKEYIQEKLGNAPYRAKFKIEKPKIILRNCKNGKIQTLVNNWYLGSMYKANDFKYFTVNNARNPYHTTVKQLLQALTDGIVPKQNKEILLHIIENKMYKHMQDIKNEST